MSTYLIQQTTKTAARFIQWVATLILQRNWFMLLVLVGVVLVGVGRSLREWINTQFFGDAPPTWFWPIYWTVMVLMFAGALTVAIANLRKPVPAPTAADLVERKAIKALRPFDRQDAEVFRHLQRQTSLRDCYAAVTAERYRFGILMGASGCGKTSFLQAGLWPWLSGSDSPYQGIYVRFSDRDPLETMRQALASQLEIPADWLQGEPDLVTLLHKAEQAAQKPLILMLDQFEQFFAHHPRKPDRQPFIDLLCYWYRQPDTTRSSLLISIRADLYHELYDLQMALGCALGPQEVIKLDKFHPTEATEILAVIADTEQLPFDRRFVAELAEQELASREDGLISPVDLQILAWMIERQKGDDLRAFNRNAFQRFGGVEGLLSRFLERTLEARIIPQQRQAAVKVLLALTDLDRQVRAGVLTLANLQTQLQASAKAEDVAEAATWLARSDVRLITPQDKDGTIGYELAHERLIPALMRLAGKELSEADRANRLLEQRVNEWLGNQQRRRYLLGWGELRQIERQRPYLIWGPKRPQKEKLLRLSRRYTYGVLGTGSAVTLLLVLAWGWLMLTPPGQIQRVRWMLAAEAQRYPEQVAMAMVKSGQVERGFAVVADHVNSSEPQSRFINAVAAAVPRLSNLAQAQDWLTRCLVVVNDIDAAVSKSWALIDIATAAGRLGDPSVTAALLERAIVSAETIDADEPKTWQVPTPRPRSQVLGAIATVAGELGESQAAAVLLERVLISAETIDAARDKSSALEAIAIAAGELEEPQATGILLEQILVSAETIDVAWAKSQVLRAIVTVAGELGEPQAAAALLEHILVSTETIDDAGSKSWLLRDIAIAYGEVGELEKATAVLLEKSIDNAETISNPREKSDALIAIATAAGELGDLQTTVTVLKRVIASAETMDDVRYKSQVLSAIATTHEELGKSQVAIVLLEQAIANAEIVKDDLAQSYALSTIAAVAGELEDPQFAVTVLDRTITIAGNIGDDLAKSQVLIAIAAAAEELGNLQPVAVVLEQAIASAESINGAGETVSALRTIAVAYGVLGDPRAAAAVLERATTSTETIEDVRDKSWALRTIVTAAGELEDPESAAVVLERVITSAETIDMAQEKSQVLKTTATVAGELGDPQSTVAVLEKVIASAGTIDMAQEKSQVLKTITTAARELEDPQSTAVVLEQATASAETIDSAGYFAGYKSEALSAIAGAYGTLREPQSAVAVLEQAIASAETTDILRAKSQALSAIASAAGEVGEPEAAATILEQVMDSAKMIDSAGVKSEVLRAIVRASETLPKTHKTDLFLDIRRVALAARDSDTLAVLAILQAREGNWGGALATLRGISEGARVRALAQILTYRAENQDWRLIPGAVVMAATVPSPTADPVIEVEIFSLDRGCQHYADWWEVLDANTGELLYRHLIPTPHLDQQSFTLSSALLSVAPDQPLIIRAHMNVGVGDTDDQDEFGNSIEPNGYTTQAMQGTLERGFRPVRLSDRFAGWVEKQAPQPEACQPG